MTWYQYKIVAGYNNAGSLVNIESITPSGDRPFIAPDGWTQYDEGLEKLRLDRLSTVVGYPATAWLFAALTRRQYSYLQSNYTLGGNSYRGKVTLRTLTYDGQTFANFNAVLVLPKLNTLQRKGSAFADVRIQFVGLVAI